MTNKQVIIDGIDVSGCKFYTNNGWCCCALVYENHCKDYSNCMYKLKRQLKRKEQECEELKLQLAHSCHDVLYKNSLAGKLDQLKAEVKSKTEYIQEQRDIINQYSKEIEMYKKCQGKRASKREEELKANNEILEKDKANLEVIKETLKVQFNQLKQTLTEIKEIAEPYNDMSGNCVIVNCFEDMYKILQKIREVLGG